MTKAHQQLIADFNMHVDRIGERLVHLEWENKAVYAHWLAQTRYLVRNTTRFLCLAAANTPQERRDLHYDWIHHLKGELNHDLVAQNDLKALGYEDNSIGEFPETRMLWQTQFYWLDREATTSALCGYAFCLEGLAANYGPKVLSRVEPAFGRKATSFLRLHAEVDVTHFADGLKTLESLPVEDVESVRLNLEQSAILYLGMSNRIAEAARHPATVKKSA